MTDRKDMTFLELRNADERAAEAKFPGYSGPRWGEFTEGKPGLDEYRWRTQVAFADGSAYWLEVPEGSVLVGDKIVVAERMATLQVVRVGVTLPKEYFEGKNPVPHKFATLLDLHRSA
jgi:hypothetical protein